MSDPDSGADLTEPETEELAFETVYVISSSPTVVDGTVYVESADSYLYAVAAASGGEKQSSSKLAPT